MIHPDTDSGRHATVPVLTDLASPHHDRNLLGCMHPDKLKETEACIYMFEMTSQEKDVAPSFLGHEKMMMMVG